MSFNMTADLVETPSGAMKVTASSRKMSAFDIDCLNRVETVPFCHYYIWKYPPHPQHKPGIFVIFDFHAIVDKLIPIDPIPILIPVDPIPKLVAPATKIPMRPYMYNGHLKE